jgi:hypothetical protein
MDDPLYIHHDIYFAMFVGACSARKKLLVSDPKPAGDSRFEQKLVDISIYGGPKRWSLRPAPNSAETPF